MAVRKNWIKNSIIASSVVLMFFSMVEIALTATVNVLLSLITPVIISINSSIEFTCISLFLMPVVWLGFAAAMSRHRGVYITLTIVISLALMSSIAFLVYEGYQFGTLGLYSSSADSFVQGMLVSKLVCWSIITLILLMMLGFSIAGDCSREIERQKPVMNDYYGMGNTMPMSYMPPEYARYPSVPRALEPVKSREYPRLTTPSAYKYGDSPRSYYNRY